MTISIVIPNWNGKELMARYLPNVIRAKDYKKNSIREIIIVDDGSTDNSVEFIKKLKSQTPNLRLIGQKENNGFSAAVNLGVRNAKGELVCLLNTDVSPSENFLENVLVHFEDKKVFGVSLHERGYGPAKGYFRNGFFEHGGLPVQSETLQTMWVSGGSGVFRRSLWKELKGFDEELFSPFYWEDVDLSYRAQKRGYRVLWEPGARVLHQHESVINASNFARRKMNLIKERNQLLFVWKNITSGQMMRKHYRGMMRRIVKGPGYILVVFLAMRKLGVVRKLRGIEVREQRVSDETIFEKFQNI